MLLFDTFFRILPELTSYSFRDGVTEVNCLLLVRLEESFSSNWLSAMQRKDTHLLFTEVMLKYIYNTARDISYY